MRRRVAQSMMLAVIKSPQEIFESLNANSLTRHIDLSGAILSHPVQAEDFEVWGLTLTQISTSSLRANIGGHV